MTKPGRAQVQPQRAGLPPPRAPRGRIGAPRSEKPPKPFQEAQFQGEQRRWFEREVRALKRLAHTERLMGDYVAAQRLERELDSFIVKASALMGRERG